MTSIDSHWPDIACHCFVLDFRQCCWIPLPQWWHRKPGLCLASILVNVPIAVIAQVTWSRFNWVIGRCCPHWTFYLTQISSTFHWSFRSHRCYLHCRIYKCQIMLRLFQDSEFLTHVEMRVSLGKCCQSPLHIAGLNPEQTQEMIFVVLVDHL